MTIREDIKVKPVRNVERMWFTRKDAAAYLGVSVELIKRLNQRGQLGFSKVGGLVFISKSEIDNLLTKSRVI